MSSCRNATRNPRNTRALLFESGAVDFEALRISDFWPGSRPRFGETEAIRCSAMHFPRHVQPRIEPAIWEQRIPVSRREPLRAVRLPDHVAIHVFAMTAVRLGDDDARSP